MKPNQCIHFNGIQHECCRAGINYRSLAGLPDFGMALRLPCWEPSMGRKGETVVVCASYLEPTAGQIAEDEAEEKTYFAKMKKVLAAIAPWRTKPPIGKVEIIECPSCSGRLHLVQAACNGHVHGKCATDGCVSWME